VESRHPRSKTTGVEDRIVDRGADQRLINDGRLQVEDTLREAACVRCQAVMNDMRRKD